MTPNVICINCETQLTGKYCSECGQKAHTTRLTLHDVFHEVWHALTHTDKGILKLVKDLAIHPKEVYFGYFKGQRKKYFSPVLFFLVTAGLVALTYNYVFDYQDKVLNTHNEFGREIYHVVKYRTLLLLVINNLIYWVFFRKRFNIAEIAVFWAFCFGFTYVIKLTCVPLYFPFIRQKDNLDNILVVISYAIMFAHSILVFGRGKVLNIILLFILMNCFLIFDGLLVRIFLAVFYGVDSAMPTIHNFSQVIKGIYSW